MNEQQIPILLLDGMEMHQNFRSHIKKLSNYIITHRIDKIHVQTNWQLALIVAVRLYLLMNHRFKVIYTIHAYRHNEHPVKALMARIIIGLMLFLFADKVICTCSFLMKKFRLLSYKIILLPLGISQSFFEDYKECDIDYLKLVFPAQFRVGKNQDIIIRAFSEYVKETNDTHASLYLPGCGYLLNEMKELTYNLQIDKQVIFPGQCSISEIKKYYLQSNIGIISSNSETFGLCIVEPYVLGRCVITRHVGVADDIIEDGVNGYFFNNKEDLKNILLNIDKEKIRIMGEYNFKYRDNFNWNNIATRYLEHLQII